MWGNGTAFSALVGGTRLEPPKYRPLMDAFFQGIEVHWDKDAPIPAYDAYFASPINDDKYYDDNAWMVITFAEAYTLTRDRRYLYRAVEVMRYVLSGWDERHGGGIYWRQERKAKTTCSNGPSATAALALAPHLNERYYISWAKRIVEWTTKNLQAPDGLFWDGMGYTGGIGKTCWTYNTALMLRANLGLYRVTRNRSYLEAARRMGEASEKLFVNRDTGAFRDDAMFSHLLVEAFLDLYQVTGEKYLIDRARANADFAWNYVRDSRDGGFWKTWKILPNRREERKTMIANTSTARLFWLLAVQEEQGKTA
jgi:predicted alpha-1,6-mannanase (GH76 family)